MIFGVRFTESLCMCVDNIFLARQFIDFVFSFLSFFVEQAEEELAQKYHMYQGWVTFRQSYLRQ